MDKKTGQVQVGDEIGNRQWNWIDHILRKQSNSITMYHKESIGLESPGQEIKRKTKGQLEKSQR